MLISSHSKSVDRPQDSSGSVSLNTEQELKTRIQEFRQRVSDQLSQIHEELQNIRSNLPQSPVKEQPNLKHEVVASDPSASGHTDIGSPPSKDHLELRNALECLKRNIKANTESSTENSGGAR
ncbi:MAG: hypothetical protein VX694_04155 [Planctomycetota bacterium]|nr:hypothetical protein [Planctomycetota bacterium]